MVVLEAAAVALAKAVTREAALAIPPLICSTTVIGHHRLAAMRRRMDTSWSAATLPGNTSVTHQARITEGGNIGLFITVVPKVLY